MTRYPPHQLRKMADDYDLGTDDYVFDIRISNALRQAADDAEKLEAVESGIDGYSERLMDAIEGVCDGISIDASQAHEILVYVMTELSMKEWWDRGLTDIAARTPKEQKE